MSSADARALAVEHGRDGIEIYPVVAGTVLEERATTVPAEGLEDALQNLNWTRTDGTGHDWDWLASWIFTPRRAGRYIVLDGTEDSSALVRREIARAPDMNAL